MGIQFPIAPIHGAQYTPPGIPVMWQYDSGRNAWRVVRGGVPWTDISGKPSTFPPSEHEHPVEDVTGLQDTLNVKQDISARGQPNGYAPLDPDGRVPEAMIPFGALSWENIENKPGEFPPSAHSHPVAEISDSSSIGQQIVRAANAYDVRQITGAISADENARVGVDKNDVQIGLRRTLNFKEGSNITLEVVDDVANEEIDITINAAGGAADAAQYIVSEIKPAAPFDKTVWLDTATGIQFTYYNDGTKAQWIEAIPFLAAMPAVFTKFVFPVAPTDGQIYEPIAGARWKWSTSRGVWFAVTSVSDAYTKVESDAKFVDLVGDTMTGVLTLSGVPTAPLHAATKGYVDGVQTNVDLKVARAGDTMSGHLGLPAGPSATQAVRKDYVDAADLALTTTANTKVNRAGDTMTGALSVPHPPTADAHAATKQYADTKVAKSGDTMTGDLKIGNANGEPNLRLDGLVSNWIIGSKNNLLRWSMKLGDAVAETGFNLGSDFVIQRWSDSGEYISDMMRLNRNGGGKLFLSPSGQYNASLTVRAPTNGASVEFGHSNPAGYGSVLGCVGSSGEPYLAFNAGPGTGLGTFKTLGIKGFAIQANLTGGLNLGQIANANADNQALTSSMFVGQANVAAVASGGGSTVQISGGVSATGASYLGGLWVGNGSNSWSGGQMNVAGQVTCNSVSTASTVIAQAPVYATQGLYLAYGTTWPSINFYGSNWASGPFTQIGGNDVYLNFSTAGIDRARVSSAGMAYPGSAGGYFNASGIFYNPSATAYKPGGGVWIDASDERIKTVEGDYTRGLDDVAQLRPVLFTFKGNETNDPPSDQYIGVEPSPDLNRDALVAPYKNSQHHMQAESGQKFTGLIAQEVETVFPEMVIQRSGYIDGQPVTDLRDLDTTPLIYALINSIKELKARVEELESTR